VSPGVEPRPPQTADADAATPEPQWPAARAAPAARKQELKQQDNYLYIYIYIYISTHILYIYIHSPNSFYRRGSGGVFSVWVSPSVDFPTVRPQTFCTDCGPSQVS
jgi:hypothetical protein